MRRLLVLACCLTACASPAEKPAATGKAGPSLPADVLTKGHPVETKVALGEVKRYRIDLAASEVAYATVDQRGLDVVATMLAPDGTKLGEVDSPIMDRGPEPVIIEAKAAGPYLIEVRLFAPPGGAPLPPTPPGTYEARVDEVVSADVHAERLAKKEIDSPRILELWKALRARTPDAESKFWAELEGKTPIVEPYPGDPKDVLVTFVFRAPGGSAYVALLGGATSAEHPMIPLAGTDTWYQTVRMPADSTFGYSFIADKAPGTFLEPYRAWGPAIPPRFARAVTDPNNPVSFFTSSETTLPGAPVQPWIVPQKDVPAGKISPLAIESTNLEEPRRIGVYTPPGYDPKKTYPLLIAFDGEMYGLDPGGMMPMPTILDNMIAAKKIPPVVLALVANQGTRDRDLTGSVPFSRFVALELVPRLRADYRAGLTPAQTIVTGSSFGGLCAVFTAFAHSDVVGNVLAQSGSYGFHPGELEAGSTLATERGWLIREFARVPRLPIRFHLDAGLFETGLANNNLEMSRHLRNVLVAKGYPVTYLEFHGGHAYTNWRGTISDGLIALLGAPAAPPR